MITSYKELPFGKYEQIQRIVEAEAEEIDKQVSILSLLTGMDNDDILDLPIAKYEECVAKSAFLQEEIPAPKGRIPSAFKVGGYDLRPAKDITKMTTAQYIDFQTFAKGGEKNLIAIASVLLVPKGKTYNRDYDILDVQNVIRQYLSVTDINELFAFFLRRFISSMKDMLNYSDWVTRKMLKGKEKEEMKARIAEAREALKTNGDGYLAWMQSAKPTGAVGM